MPLNRQAVFMDVDISALVDSWGNLEQIKDVLLVNATFMTGQHTLQLLNKGGAFSPGAGGSLTAGLNWYNQLISINVEGRTIYQGFVKDIQTNNTRTVAKILSENVFKAPSEKLVVLAGTSQNPADVMLAIARQAVADTFIDVASFGTAAAPSRVAHANIDYNFAAGSNVTVLSALQKIGALASISCFVLNNRITARAFQPYQGSLSDLRFEINDQVVREWADFSFDYSSFQNETLVGFTGGGSAFFSDPVSRRINNIDREFDFPASATLGASDLTSAQFFGPLFLKRASLRRGLLAVAGGRELKDVAIGDRFPVTNPRLGLVSFPMEAIEVHPHLDNEEFEVHLAQLQPA